MPDITKRTDSITSEADLETATGTPMESEAEAAIHDAAVAAAASAGIGIHDSDAFAHGGAEGLAASAPQPADITDGHLLGRSGAGWAGTDPATFGGSWLSEDITSENITGTDTSLSDTLSQAPSDATAVMLFLNGQRMEYGVGADFTISGQTITWLASTGTAPDITTASELHAYYGTPAGTSHTQGTDAALDTGGVNEVTAVTLKATVATVVGLGTAAAEDVATGGTGDLLRNDGDGSGLTDIIALTLWRGYAADLYTGTAVVGGNLTTGAWFVALQPCVIYGVRYNDIITTDPHSIKASVWDSGGTRQATETEVHAGATGISDIMFTTPWVVPSSEVGKTLTVGIYETTGTSYTRELTTADPGTFPFSVGPILLLEGPGRYDTGDVRPTASGLANIRYGLSPIVGTLSE